LLKVWWLPFFGTHCRLPRVLSRQSRNALAIPFSFLSQFAAKHIILWHIRSYVQGHWFWHQSRARKQLPISPS